MLSISLGTPKASVYPEQQRWFLTAAGLKRTDGLELVSRIYLLDCHAKRVGKPLVLKTSSFRSLVNPIKPQKPSRSSSAAPVRAAVSISAARPQW